MKTTGGVALCPVSMFDRLLFIVTYEDGYTLELKRK